MKIHDPFDITNRQPTLLYIQRRLFLICLCSAWSVYHVTTDMVWGLKIFIACWAISFIVTRKEPRMPEIILNVLFRKRAYDAGRFKG